jgi:hypothetical protein
MIATFRRLISNFLLDMATAQLPPGSRFGSAAISRRLYALECGMSKAARIAAARRVIRDWGAA